MGIVKKENLLALLSELTEIDELKERLKNEKGFFKQVVAAFLTTATEVLDERTHDILFFRYGFADGEEKSLLQCGEQFGITREAVRQVLEKGLSILKEPTVRDRIIGGKYSFRRIDIPMEYRGKLLSAGEVLPLLDDKNNPITYIPSQSPEAAKYLNDSAYSLMDDKGTIIGDKEFCRITVSKEADPQSDVIELPDKRGVYLWVINNTVVYIGRAASKSQTLYKRFKNGYSKIGVRPCFKRGNVRGQATNLKMNRLVLELYKKNVPIQLFYIEDEQAVALEALLLRDNWKYRDEKNAVEGFYPLMYNKRR